MSLSDTVPEDGILCTKGIFKMPTYVQAARTLCLCMHIRAGCQPT